MTPILYDIRHLQHLNRPSREQKLSYLLYPGSWNFNILDIEQDPFPEESFYYLIDGNHVTDRLHSVIDYADSESLIAFDRHPVDPRVLECISQGRAKFLFSRLYHGYHDNVLSLIVEFFAGKFSGYNITADSFVFLMPAGGRRNSKFNVVDHAYYEVTTPHYLDTVLTEFKPRSKRFICFNHRHIPERLATAILLAPYRDRGLVTYVESPHRFSVEVPWGPFAEFNDLYPTIKHTLPWVWDIDFNNGNNSDQYVFPQSEEYTALLLDSYLYVINETYMVSDNIPQWHSEKTFKAIAHMLPFVLTYAPQGSIAALRDLGYQTFHPWIDESYDQIEDPVLRLKAAVAEVIRIINMSDSECYAWFQNLIPALHYNWQHLRDRQDFEKMSQRLNQDLADLLVK